MKSCCKDVLEQEEKPQPEHQDKSNKLRQWLKRIGVAGFLFFLIKGLVWVFVLWGGTKLLGCD
jgi:hypothetical protein